jgi:hypothetical protein
MAQSDYLVEDGPGLEVRSQINIIFQSVVTNNSGPTEPTHMFPGMFWLDTSPTAPALPILRIRNQQNSAWGVLSPAGATVLASGAIEVAVEHWGRSTGDEPGDVTVAFPEPYKRGSVPEVIVSSFDAKLGPGEMVGLTVTDVDETGFTVARRLFDGTDIYDSDTGFTWRARGVR